MRCALLFYLVTIFVIVYSLPEPCVIEDNGGINANCGRDKVENIFDFIPPVYQFITHFVLEGQPLKQLPYNAFQNLSSQSSVYAIWLEYCQISHVDAGALLNLHNLTIIDLSHNDINQIDSKLFSDTKQIKRIYMQHNKIEVLPDGLFQNLTLLTLVYLYDNRIRRVEWFSFKNTPSLWIIDLDNNQIEFMDMFFKDKFDNLTTLSLDGNPWKCNCELGPLYEFITKINNLKLTGLVCEKPPTLQGRKWKDISRDKFVCRSEDAMSTQDSVMTITNTEPMPIIEQDYNIPLAIIIGAKDQQVGIGIPQPASNHNWTQIIILGLMFVSIIPVTIAVVLVVRHTLATSNRRRQVWLPTIVERVSDRRTNSCNMDTGLPMRGIQSRAVSEIASNMADMQ